MFDNNQTKNDIAEILNEMNMTVDDESGEIQLTPSPLGAPAVTQPNLVQGQSPPVAAPQAGAAPPQHDWEKRFKDTQAALSRSQQESKLKDEQVNTLSTQVAELAGKLDTFLAQDATVGQIPSPFTASDPYELLSDPQKFETAISTLVEKRVQDQLAQYKPELGIDPEQAKDLMEDLRNRRELQQMVVKYPNALHYAPDVAKVLEKYPEMTMTQAYEALVEFGQNQQQQQTDQGTVDPNSPTYDTGKSSLLTPGPTQGVATPPASDPNQPTAQEMADLAAKRQVEISEAGQRGEREVNTPADAVEMALEDMYG